MKTIASILFALTLLVLVPGIQSCKKYPDGPAVSLRSRAERVSNTWRVENYKINGRDYTSLIAGYTETFFRDGNYSYSWGIKQGTGTWIFQNRDEEIQLIGNDDQSSRKLYILKLEEKSFWYYYYEGGDMHELHLISG